MTAPQDPTTPGEQPGPGAPPPWATPPAPGYGPPPGTPPGPPPGWGPPPGYGGYPPYGAPAAPRTNVLAILALVTAFLCAPAGPICGFIALGQIKQSGEEGRGLAIAGIVIGGLQVLLGLGFFLLVLGAGVAAT